MEKENGNYYNGESMEKNMENEMETGIIWGIKGIRVVFISKPFCVFKFCVASFWELGFGF